MAKFIMNIADVKDMIREKYCLPDSVEILVEIASSNNTEPNFDEWFDVPQYWTDWAPPENASRFDKIDVIFNDSRKDVGYPRSWDQSWDQSKNLHITKYRKFKSTT